EEDLQNRQGRDQPFDGGVLQREEEIGKARQQNAGSNGRAHGKAPKRHRPLSLIARGAAGGKRQETASTRKFFPYVLPGRPTPEEKPAGRQITRASGTGEVYARGMDPRRLGYAFTLLAMMIFCLQ